MLDTLSLVHMNGRVYDPTLGRFLSADPFVDDAGNSQSYNRYSYVSNDPLNHTDPSGFLKWSDVLPAIIGIVVAAVVIVAMQPGAFPALSNFFNALNAALAKGGVAIIAGGASGGFASGFSGSLLNGGSIGDAFKAGAIGAAVGAATAWASGQIGQFFNGLDGAWADEMFSNWAGRTVAHGLVGGAASELQGGQFRHGFYSSAAAAGVMHIRGVGRFMGGEKGGAWIAARTATAAAVGGTASVLSGGKFANGAVTSAFQHLFNSEAGNAIRSRNKVMFLRLNYFEGSGTTVTADTNSISWEQLIALKKDSLAPEESARVRFELASNLAEAIAKVRIAYDQGYDVIISSHGRPSDPNGDLKAFFKTSTQDKTAQSAANFRRQVNDALGVEFLTESTKWFSCDWVNGSRSPQQIYAEPNGVGDSIDDILKR